MRTENLASFCFRMSCATKTCLVLLPHAMRARNDPRFASACHARRKLASFCFRTPCAPKTCPVLLQHAMRAENLPRFAPACHAHRNLGLVLLQHAMRARNDPLFLQRMRCALRNAVHFTGRRRCEIHARPQFRSASKRLVAPGKRLESSLYPACFSCVVALE